MLFQKHGSISYKYSDNHKPDLVVILPQALLTYDESTDLVNLLSKSFNTLFISSGYFGITRISNSADIPKFTLTEFTSNLNSLLQKLTYKNLFIAAGSVGGIHALNYLFTYPDQVKLVALAGPALYKKKSIPHLVFKFLLNLGISLNSEKFFNFFINTFKHHSGLSWLNDLHRGVTSKIGALSYLLCLREIVEFTTQTFPNIDTDLLISKKVHVFLGKDDNVFKRLCDENLCQQAKSCSWTNSDHSVLIGSRNEIFNLFLSSRTTAPQISPPIN